MGLGQTGLGSGTSAVSFLGGLAPARSGPWTQPWPGSDLPPREILTASANTEVDTCVAWLRPLLCTLFPD